MNTNREPTTLHLMQIRPLIGRPLMALARGTAWLADRLTGLAWRASDDLVMGQSMAHIQDELHSIGLDWDQLLLEDPDGER